MVALIEVVSCSSPQCGQDLDIRDTERETDDDSHLRGQLHLQTPYQVDWENEKGDLEH